MGSYGPPFAINAMRSGANTPFGPATAWSTVSVRTGRRCSDMRDLYRQFADWSAIVAADVHQPVGRLGELVVYGAQQTKPYWLATARSLEVRPGEEQRIRRSVFQRGWRGDAFRAAHRQILEQFAEDHPFSEVPNPFHDAADGYGARERALGAFARSTEASEIKRRQLEAQVRENFVQPGGGLANPEEVTAVEGRFGKFDSLDDFFDLSGGGGLSGFLLSARGPLRPSGHGGIREVVQSQVSRPRSGAVNGDRRRDNSIWSTVATSQRRAP